MVAWARMIESPSHWHLGEPKLQILQAADDALGWEAGEMGRARGSEVGWGVNGASKGGWWLGVVMG